MRIILRKLILLLFLFTFNLQLCFSQEEPSGKSKDRCAVILQDSEFKLFKRLSLKYQRPVREFYGNDNMTFIAMKDSSEDAQVDALSASIDKIEKCIRSGKKVNFLVFAHTNDYPEYVLTRLKARLSNSNINISDHLEFVYNSGCANGVDGGLVTELGAKFYIGHGAEGISCSPVWLFNFFKNLRFLEKDLDKGILHAVAIANHKFDQGDAPGKFLCPDKTGKNKVASEVATQAFVRMKSKTDVIEAIKSGRLPDIFPLASNIDMVKQLTCLNLRVQFDMHKKAIRKVFSDPLERELQRASYDLIGNLPGGYQGFKALKCDEKFDKIKDAMMERFAKCKSKSTCIRGKCHNRVTKDLFNLCHLKAMCTKRSSTNDMLCDVKKYNGKKVSSKIIRCNTDQEIFMHDLVEFSYNSNSYADSTFRSLKFKSLFDSKEESSWHKQFPDHFHLQGFLKRKVKIPTGESTREFYGKDLKETLSIKENPILVPEFLDNMIDDRYTSICGEITNQVDKVRESNAGRSSLKSEGSSTSDDASESARSKSAAH